MVKSLYNELRKALQSCKKGKKLFNNLKKRNSDKKILLFPHKSLGDIYILSLYKNSNSLVFADKYVLVVIGNNCMSVAKQFGFADVLAITEESMFQIIEYIMFMGEEKLNCKILHFLYYHTSVFYSIINYKKYNFIQCYSDFVFHKLIDNSCIKYKQKKCSACILRKYPIIQGKTVVISPYAKSITNFSFDVWTNIVMVLRNQGFKRIYTNCAGDESPILGTIKLTISLSKISSFLDEAGIFIGLRSGLCDLISQSQCKKIILYPEDSYIKNSLDFYSLRLLPNTINFKEFTIYDECVPYDDILKYLEA